jgi:hypothetical protein
MGKSMQALTVFSLAIRYLKEHLQKKLQEAVKGMIQDEDLYFVLTASCGNYFVHIEYKNKFNN